MVNVEIVSNNTMLNHHLTLFIKGILGSRESVSRCEFFTQVNTGILSKLIVVINKVIAAFKFDQLICSLHSIVNVEIVPNNTMLNHHLTVCIKGIPSSGEAVCRCEFFTQVNARILSKLIIVVDEVVAAFKFDQLICFCFFSINIEIPIIWSSQKTCNAISATIIINHGSLHTDHSGCIKISNYTGLHITVSIE